jgi:hypothetical protein
VPTALEEPVAADSRMKSSDIPAVRVSRRRAGLGHKLQQIISRRLWVRISQVLHEYKALFDPIAIYCICRFRGV